VQLTTDAETSGALGAQANIASLTESLKANPGDASAHNVRGTAYARAGRPQEALADFNAAIQIDPSMHQAYANRALVQRQLGR
ncbi:tetratricopeptide repeat protein, partial [Mycobacterium tuberculosis]|nr:tetratricopeptide repeat protein [Mycobacterium tuberculosis]